MLEFCMIIALKIFFRNFLRSTCPAPSTTMSPTPVCNIGSAQIARQLGRLNPLILLEWDPLAVLNFNPLNGGSPQHPSTLAMNGLLPINTRPPSTSMHSICISKTFRYEENVFLLNLALNTTKFAFSTSKVWNFGEEALPPPTVGSRKVPSWHYIRYPTRASIQPPSCF